MQSEAAVDSIVRDVAVAALLLSGILAGLSLDKVIVQLPARRRMGAVAYAGYARAADLGNGVVFYAVVGIAAAVLTVVAFGLTLTRSTPETVRVLLGAGAGLSVLHSAATGRAAPMMFRIGRAEDTKAILEPLLTRFARWSAVRAALQVATFVVLVAAVTAGT
jgi:hypothetical protein